MIDSQKQEFDRILSAVAQMYSKQMTKPTFDLYFAALKKYDFKSVRSALEAHLINPDVGQYMPKPADVVREIDGGTEDRALLAWTKTFNTIKSVGCWDTVVFDDWKIHAVISEMGGWVTLCKMQTKEAPFKEKEFVTRYRSIRSARPYPKAMIGTIEAHNRPLGYTEHIPAARLIGDAGKCKEVMHGGKRPEQLMAPRPVLEYQPTQKGKPHEY